MFENLKSKSVRESGKQPNRTNNQRIKMAQDGLRSQSMLGSFSADQCGRNNGIKTNGQWSLKRLSL